VRAESECSRVETVECINDVNRCLAANLFAPLNEATQL
jgi:hypothetical protein